ncbi:MAG TPA: pyridoxamine 5'-phosphate oxidase family protein [Desulfuromonadales bacterium]|nr:pyridoxamine 5'-phosphate oxidase family protein [Desulfuromonadales bacterium]
MRRAACEIKNSETIHQILQKSHVCRLGLVKDNIPYIVPVSFGYCDNAIYFHTAQEGLKIDFIAAGNIACFEIELGVGLLTEGSNPCDWGFSYQSVIGHGTIHELTDHQQKVKGLELILLQYVEGKWPMAAQHVEHTRVWRLGIESITGKQSEDHFCP